MTLQVLLHEICHSFLFFANHSWGLGHFMQPVTFYVVPGIMPLNRSIYFKERGRKEILKNNVEGLLNASGSGSVADRRPCNPFTRGCTTSNRVTTVDYARHSCG
jgi:hypothetical protein